MALFITYNSDAVGYVPGRTPIYYATHVFTCLVYVIIDNVLGFTLITHTLSHKYISLQLAMIVKHLFNIEGLTIQTAIEYQHSRMQRAGELTKAGQPAVTTALLMLLLRVCQPPVMLWAQITRENRVWPQAQIVAVLTVPALFLVLLLLHLISVSVST